MILCDELQEIGRRVRVLRDRVLVKPLPYVHPTLLTPGIEVQKGVVVAIGYGRRQRRKVRFAQMEGHLGRALEFEDGEETGRILPMKVAVGDVVEFSPRNVWILKEEDLLLLGLPDVGDMLMVWQNGIMSIDPEESLSDSLMWQTPAGYDRHGNFMSGAESWARA